MDYRWSIFGGRGKEQGTFFGGKKALFLIKNIMKGVKKHIAGKC
jgi:hypothetical protein